MARPKASAGSRFYVGALERKENVTGSQTPESGPLAELVLDRIQPRLKSTSWSNTSFQIVAGCDNRQVMCIEKWSRY